MKNNIRLTESQLRALVSEASKKVLNEISYGTVKNAASQTNYWRDNNGTSFDDYDGTTYDLIDYYDIFNSIRKINIALGHFNDRLELVVADGKNHFWDAWKFFERKQAQHENFEKEIENEELRIVKEVTQQAVKFGGKKFTGKGEYQNEPYVWEIVTKTLETIPEENLDAFMESLSPDTVKYLVEDEGFVSYYQGHYSID